MFLRPYAPAGRVRGPRRGGGPRRAARVLRQRWGALSRQRRQRGTTEGRRSARGVHVLRRGGGVGPLRARGLRYRQGGETHRRGRAARAPRAPPPPWPLEETTPRDPQSLDTRALGALLGEPPGARRRLHERRTRGGASHGPRTRRKAGARGGRRIGPRLDRARSRRGERGRRGLLADLAAGGEARRERGERGSPVRLRRRHAPSVSRRRLRYRFPSGVARALSRSDAVARREPPGDRPRRPHPRRRPAGGARVHGREEDNDPARAVVRRLGDAVHGRASGTASPARRIPGGRRLRRLDGPRLLLPLAPLRAPAFRLRSAEVPAGYPAVRADRGLRARAVPRHAARFLHLRDDRSHRTQAGEGLMGLRILVVSYRDMRHPEAGGAEVIVHEIFRRLVSRGHEVHFLTGGFPEGAAEDRMDGYSIHRVGRTLSFAPLAPVAYIRRLRQLRFDVIFEDLNKIPLMTPLWDRRVPVLANVPASVRNDGL